MSARAIGLTMLERLGSAMSFNQLPRAGDRRDDFPDWNTLARFMPGVERLEHPKAVELVPVVYACITKIQNDLAARRVHFYEGEGKRRRELERQRGNIVDKWLRPNPRQTGYQLAIGLQGSLDHNGNGYLFVETFGMKNRALWELHVIPGQYVTPQPGPGRTIAYFDVLAGGSPMQFPPKRPDDAEPGIIHMQYWHPDDVPYGLSPLSAARLLYEASYNVQQWMNEFYKKNPVLGGIFTSTAGARLNAQEIKDRQDEMQRRYGGPTKGWRPVILENLKFERMAMTFEEMQFLETAGMTKADVAMVYLMPPTQIGIRTAGAMGNQLSGGDALQYWGNCQSPRGTLRDSSLTELLCPLWGDGISMETDFSDVLEIQNARLDQAKAVVIATGGPVLTPDEGRDLIEEEPLNTPESTTLRQPSAPFGTPSGNDPAPAGPPPGPAAKAATPSKKETHSAALELASEADRARAARRASANLAVYERQLERMFTQLFTDQEQTLLARLRELLGAEPAAASRERATVDLEQLLEPGDDDEARLSAILADLMKARGDQALAELGLELELNVQAQRFADYLKRQVNRALTKTTQTTRDALRNSLAEGLSRNEGLAELVARVHQVFEGRRGNAATIARTEALPAYTVATQEAWAQSGVVKGQVWLSARDDAVRPSHAEADGQVVLLGGTFRVGSSQMSGPGDLSAPIEEVANCRCALEAVLDDEAVAARRFERWLQGKETLPGLNGHQPVAVNRLEELFAR